MANQSGITTLLDKLKQQLKVYQQAGIIPSRDKEPLQGQPDPLDTEAYVGLPLEIGSELLITAEMVKLYPGLSNALGRVVIIDQIPADENNTIKASAFGIQVDVDMKLAWQMRAAYVRREQASS